MKKSPSDRILVYACKEGNLELVKIFEGHLVLHKTIRNAISFAAMYSQKEVFFYLLPKIDFDSKLIGDAVCGNSYQIVDQMFCSKKANIMDVRKKDFEYSVSSLDEKMIILFLFYGFVKKKKKFLCEI